MIGHFIERYANGTAAECTGFRLGPLSGMWGDGWFWVRLGPRGRGLSVKDTRKEPLLFSERNGYTKGWKVGPYWLRFLEECRMVET